LLGWNVARKLLIPELKKAKLVSSVSDPDPEFNQVNGSGSGFGIRIGT
jgi:hypothetical protein